MILIEEKIRNWKETIATRADQISRDCTATFLASIASTDFPDAKDMEQARVIIQDKASMLFTSDEILTALPNGPSELNTKEALRMSWLSLMPKLILPVPNPELELAAWRLAMAGALGSLLGMFLIGGLMHWWLNMRDAGMLFGASIGAFSLVYGAWFVARSTAVRTALVALIGVSTVEPFIVFFNIGFGGLWKRLIGTGSLLKRFFVYFAIIGLLMVTRLFTRQNYRYDQETFKQLVHYTIINWIDYGTLLLLSLATERSEITQRKELDPAMARSIVNLHASSAVDLPLSAEGVLQEARRLGLDGVDSQPRFVNQYAVKKQELRWENELNQKYKCFGIVENGEIVVVEEEPVVQNGVVIDFGRVRKVRHPLDKGNK